MSSIKTETTHSSTLVDASVQALVAEIARYNAEHPESGDIHLTISRITNHHVAPPKWRVRVWDMVSLLCLVYVILSIIGAVSRMNP